VMDEKDARRAEEAAEELDRLARESYKAAVEQAFEAQKSGIRLSRRFFENWVETLEDHAELNRRTMQGLTELVREQREVFQQLSRESLGAYDDFIESLSSFQDQLESDEEGSGAEGSTAPQGRASEHKVWQGTGQGVRESYLSLLERTGEMKPGSGDLPPDFWDLPRPEDPDASVRRAVQEDRR
jgi:hypothetical protein